MQVQCPSCSQALVVPALPVGIVLTQGADSVAADDVADMCPPPIQQSDAQRERSRQSTAPVRLIKFLIANYVGVLKKYAVFTGRARRREYWCFVLCYWLVYLGLCLLDGAMGLRSAPSNAGLLSGLYGLAVLLPYVAVSVRRLHDTNHSGWWYFGALLILSFGLQLPFIGPVSGAQGGAALMAIVGLVLGLMCLMFSLRDSQTGRNQYGPNPKEKQGSSRIYRASVFRASEPALRR